MLARKVCLEIFGRIKMAEGLSEGRRAELREPRRVACLSAANERCRLDGHVRILLSVRARSSTRRSGPSAVRGDVLLRFLRRISQYLGRSRLALERLVCGEQTTRCGRRSRLQWPQLRIQVGRLAGCASYLACAPIKRAWIAKLDTHQRQKWTPIKAKIGCQDWTPTK